MAKSATTVCRHRWGRDQYVAAGFERVGGFGLEVVQFEGQGFGESCCCGRPMALDFLE